jgi:GDP-D-mannose dehydratase
MNSLHTERAIVIGASGQDGYFLTRSLLAEGKMVHAIVRGPEGRNELSTLSQAATLHVHEVDLAEPAKVTLIATTR